MTHVRNGNEHVAGYAVEFSKEVQATEEGDLPYLFKILSVNTALSIQAHPDIPAAIRLHRERPEVYKDPNHKPEMACAITDFECLCGFQPIRDVLEYIQSVPELGALLQQAKEEASKEIVDLSSEENQSAMLKRLFSALMKCDAAFVKPMVEKLQQRLEAAGDAVEMPHKLALRLTKQYPGDVGVFCVYFLCYKCLKPGQATFLAANEPHAYLSGDCAEIMARSDNVVRAGLTPKLRDVDTLLSMLTYSQLEHKTKKHYHPGRLLAGAKRDANTVVYAPPDPAVTEFEMERTVVQAGKKYQAGVSTYGSVIFILQGQGKAGDMTLKRGDTFYLPAGKPLHVEATEEIVYFRASTRGSIQSR